MQAYVFSLRNSAITAPSLQWGQNSVENGEDSTVPHDALKKKFNAE
jgi:hypothetical protein